MKHLIQKLLFITLIVLLAFFIIKNRSSENKKQNSNNKCQNCNGCEIKDKNNKEKNEN